MTTEFINLNNAVTQLQEDVKTLEFQDKLLEEKIEGRLQIAEHTNIFLDVIFIVLSVILWAITMQGWRNSKDVESERTQLRELLEKDRKEVSEYKKNLESDRKKFELEYQKTIEDTLNQINVNKKKIEDGYRVMQERYEEIISNIKGISEYYLELVSISHEPDLSERIFEYEKILKNSLKYNLSDTEKARVLYYLSITLYELATKTPEAKNKSVLEWIKKASKYISNAVNISADNGTYFYEKAKIELEKYRLQLIQEGDFANFTQKINQIAEYFRTALQKSDVEFYMFEETVLLLNEFAKKLTQKPSEKRVILDLISMICDNAKLFDEASYIEDLAEIKLEVVAEIDEQNKRLDK